MSTILSPLTAVLGPIVPRLLTEAVTETAFPLTGVYCTRFKCVWRTLLSLLVGTIQVLGNSLTGLLLREILAATELLCSQHRNQSASCMPTPEGLQFDDEAHFRLQKSVIVAIPTRCCPLALHKTLSSGQFSLNAKLTCLVVHVELGMLTVFSHAVRAIGGTVSHFNFSSYR